MDNLHQRLLQGAKGEFRLNPDEARAFLGTYAERVALSVLTPDAKNMATLEHFPQILEDLNQAYAPLKVKLSSSLSDNLQLSFMKIAKKHGIPAIIFQEMESHTPFGILVFSDHAINRNNTDIRELYPDIFQEKTPESKKKSFWNKLFG